MIVCVIMSMVVSCNSSGCLQNRNSVPLAGFYSSSNNAAISLDSLLIIGLGMPADDPLSAPGKSIGSIYLPMRATQNTTTWVFEYKWEALDYPQLNDTISFEYESTPYFASNDCGVIYKYLITNLKHTVHLIDSVEIVDSLITNVDVEQIKIYFRTGNQDDSESKSRSNLELASYE